MALAGTQGRQRIYLMRHGAVSYFDTDGKPRNNFAHTPEITITHWLGYCQTNGS